MEAIANLRVKKTNTSRLSQLTQTAKMATFYISLNVIVYGFPDEQLSNLTDSFINTQMTASADS